MLGCYLAEEGRGGNQFLVVFFLGCLFLQWMKNIEN
jgi:hypothetical protein